MIKEKIKFVGNKNVDYTQPSNSRSFEYMNNFINANRMAKGNSKLHKMLVFDLTAIVSCPNCASCKSSCYAVKAEVQYAACLLFRGVNFYMANFDLSTLQSLIEEQLTATKFKVVRLHGSGDFFSQEYIDFWAKIIAKFPQINFYAYTKAEKIFDFSTIESLTNFNLILSLIDGKLNYGSLDYCKKLEKNNNAFICPCGIDESKKCGIDCNYCVTGKKVVFLIH